MDLLPNAATLKAMLQSRAGLLVGRAVQLLITGFVFYMLVSKMSMLGWREVQAALPENPLFYALFCAMYFALPVGEWLVYQKLWGGFVRAHFPVFLKMRVYNLALVSYAGEAFLAFWGSKQQGISGRRAAAAVKDSNILSALASNSFTLLLVGWFFLTDQAGSLGAGAESFNLYAGIVAVLGLILVPLVLRFQSKIIAAPAPVALRVFMIHLLRLLVVLLLQVGQWAIILPDVGLSTWLLLLTAQMVLTRVPFLPNTDLLLVGLGVSMMGFIDGPEVVIAGMFLAAGALSQFFNLGAFLLTSIPERLGRKLVA